MRESRRSRRLFALIGVLLALTACGSAPSAIPLNSPTPTAGSSSPTASLTPTPVGSPSVSPESTPSWVLPTCRLPITWSIFNSSSRDWSALSAGFLSLPSGSITEDIDATAMAARNGRPFYDRAVARWIPTTRNYVSPDGRFYVYMSPTMGSPTSVHIVDAVTGADRVLASGPWWPMDFGPRGVYAARAEQVAGEEGGVEVRPHGLYYLPLGGGTPTKLSDLDVVTFNLGAGSGWGLVSNPPPFMPNQVVRFDLSTGATEEWFATPEAKSSPAYIALTNLVVDGTGYPVVVGRTASGFDLLSVRKKGTPVSLYHSVGDHPVPQGPFAVDDHGVWLTTFGDEPFNTPPWFVRTDDRLFQLPSVGPRSVEVAGGCL